MLDLFGFCFVTGVVDIPGAGSALVVLGAVLVRGSAVVVLGTGDTAVDGGVARWGVVVGAVSVLGTSLSGTLESLGGYYCEFACTTAIGTVGGVGLFGIGIREALETVGGYLEECSSGTASFRVPAGVRPGSRSCFADNPVTGNGGIFIRGTRMDDIKGR